MRWCLLLLWACTGSDPVDPNPDVTDADGDGFTPNTGDCDDGDATISPGAEEIWYDGVDQDCDGRDDDQDEDGFELADDCNDEDSTILPGAVDTLGDEVDQDCDGTDRAGLSAYQIGEGLHGPRMDGDGDEIVVVVPKTPDLRTVIERFADGLASEGRLQAIYAGEAEEALDTGPAATDLLLLDGVPFMAQFFPDTDPGPLSMFTVLAQGESELFWSGFYTGPTSRVQMSYDSGLDRLFACFVGEVGGIVVLGVDALDTLQDNLNFVYFGGVEALDCQRRGSLLWVVESDAAVQLEQTGPSAIVETGITIPGSFTALQWEEDVLALSHAGGVSVVDGEVTHELAVANLVAARFDRRPDGSWVVLTGDSSGNVVLHEGASWDALSATSLATDVVAEDLDVEANAEGVIYGVRTSNGVYLGRSIDG